jgi:DNA repair photolyase
MIIKEIESKTILSKSQIYPYVINPYVGCQHACTYCYARFMKRFTHHLEPWGQFVDIKINAVDLLEKEIKKKKPARVWVSGVCDPYQPVEGKYRLTHGCLEVLMREGWPVTVQTRSSLALRDIDIFKQGNGWEVGLSVTTADDNIRKLFEPSAPPIRERFRALDELHHAGIKTYAMIAPMLPGAAGLAGMLVGKVDYVLIDRMNYRHSDWVYRKYGLQEQQTDQYFMETRQQLDTIFRAAGVPVSYWLSLVKEGGVTHG